MPAPPASGLLAGLGGEEAAVAKHFVAVSTNAEEVGEVRHRHRRTCSASGSGSGGRYSMDSAIGLSTMLAIGPARFAEMLAGFHAIDEHFREAPLAANLPVLHGPAGASGTATSSAPRPSPSSPTTSTCTASPPTSSS